MAKKAEWLLKTSDMGMYLQCSLCNRKISAKDFIFADIKTDVCPSCSAEMDLDKLDEDTLSQLSQEASNGRT